MNCRGTLSPYVAWGWVSSKLYRENPTPTVLDCDYLGGLLKVSYLRVPNQYPTERVTRLSKKIGLA